MYIMHRYLINVSYIGTPFRGMQRQIPYKNPKVVDPFTVQGQIDIALKQLNSRNPPQTFVSSRTDAGVHAFHSTLHTDLERPSGSHYQPQTITLCLNKYFIRNGVPIRVLKTYLVPNDFNCRFKAISRAYLYRLCVIKTYCENLSIARGVCHIPIEETDRCMFLCTDTFDVDKVKEASKLFLGLHDFRTFMRKGPSQPEKVTRRVIDRLDFTEACSACYRPYSWPQCMSNDKSEYRFFDIYIKSSGFLYNQVRRTVAALIAVAQGKVTTKDIKFMLEIPSHQSWNPSVKTVPAHGLYLCQVEYAKSDLETFKETLE